MVARTADHELMAHQVGHVQLLQVDKTDTYTYRDEIYCLQILLSRTQAGPDRTVKQEQEEISLNHVRRINLISVLYVTEPP